MPKVIAGYKEAARARIVEAAIELFTRKGFDGATMDEIAKSVGVSKPALYRYFPGKDALLEAVFAGSQARLSALLREAFEGRSLQAGIKVLFDNLEALFGSSYALQFDWFAKSAREDRLRQMVRADGERDVETLARFLTEQRRRGALRSRASTRALAQLFETAFVGAWVRIALGHDREDAVRSLQDLANLLETR